VYGGPSVQLVCDSWINTGGISFVCQFTVTLWVVFIENRVFFFFFFFFFFLKEDEHEDEGGRWTDFSGR
jgi:hypothetical protein